MNLNFREKRKRDRPKVIKIRKQNKIKEKRKA
jgi:hypothetical protein